MNSLFTLKLFFVVVVVDVCLLLQIFTERTFRWIVVCLHIMSNVCINYTFWADAIQIIIIRFLMHVSASWIVCKRTHVKGVEINDVICQYTKDDDIDCDCLLYSLLFHNNPECFRFFSFGFFCMNTVASCIC